MLKARADKKNCKRVREEPLFEGYLFVRFDPELVHTTKITQRPGVNYFVRFGGEPWLLPDALTIFFVCAGFKHYFFGE